MTVRDWGMVGAFTPFVVVKVVFDPGLLISIGLGLGALIAVLAVAGVWSKEE